MKIIIIFLTSIFLFTSCATIVNDANVPVALSFSDGSEGECHGFSGESQGMGFTFSGGRIIDPENRYVFSYTENEVINLSGNLSGENYDYFINQTPVCFAGKRTPIMHPNWSLICPMTTRGWLSRSGPDRWPNRRQ